MDDKGSRESKSIKTIKKVKEYRIESVGVVGPSTKFTVSQPHFHRHRLPLHI
jgi:hypothetical protein